MPGGVSEFDIKEALIKAKSKLTNFILINIKYLWENQAKLLYL